MIPRQLGPTIDMSFSRAICLRRFSRSIPSPPISLKPAEMTSTWRVPSSRRLQHHRLDIMGRYHDHDHVRGFADGARDPGKQGIPWIPLALGLTG